jgi:diguanylate cyclase (GGDEF)-like protein
VALPGTDSLMRLTDINRAEAVSHFSDRAALPAVWSWIVLIAALLLIFALDRATGSAPVQHLYYLPIIFAGIRFGLRGGLAAALAAILSYHLANPHLLTFKYEQSDVVQVGLFIAVGVLTARLTLDSRRLHALAMTDDLTGLHNLRSFEARLSTMVRASSQAKTPLALLVLDVDRLKSLNDKYGHLAGSEAVRTVGQILGARVPPDAVACRFGGDEFVVALPHCTKSRANAVADDLRRAVNEIAPVLAGVQFPVARLSISIGIACRDFDEGLISTSDDASGAELFRAADAALYVAKERGRNQVSAGHRASTKKVR